MSIVVYLCLAFLASFFVVTAKRLTGSQKLSIQNDPVSAYLTGEWGYLLDVGFICLATAFVLLTNQLPFLTTFGYVAFIVGAIGTLGAMLTKRIPALLNQNINSPKWEKPHLLTAALAFGGAGVAELVYSVDFPTYLNNPYLFWIALIAPVLCLVNLKLKVMTDSILEKSCTFALVGWVLALELIK